MAVTFTTNKGFAEVTVGTESGTWGPYVNGNAALMDSALGAVATVALTNSPVTLSSGQYSCAFIRFTGAISADVPITFPAVGSFYTIINDTTNSSAFVVTALTTAAGGRTIGIPPGNMTDILTDGANARFRGLPPVGSYWDFAGSSVPRWVGACTIAPWLNCDGTGFSAVTYPSLAALFGGTTLPDLRGGFRATLNQGTGRLTAPLDGNTLFATGGNEATTIQQTHLPNYNLNVSDPGHTHALSAQTGTFAGPGGQTTPLSGPFRTGSGQGQTQSNTTGITVNSGGGGTNISRIAPATVGGITLVRGG